MTYNGTMKPPSGQREERRDAAQITGSWPPPAHYTDAVAVEDKYSDIFHGTRVVLLAVVVLLAQCHGEEQFTSTQLKPEADD